MVICGGGLWLVLLSTQSAIYLWKKKHLIREIHTKGGENVIGCSFRAFNHRLSTIEPKENKSFVNNVQRGLYSQWPLKSLVIMKRHF